MKLGVSDSFRGRADAAAYWEAWTGAVLSRAGLYTEHYPFHISEGPGGIDYSQTWDLNVSKRGGPYTEVEVKSVNLTFTSVQDYPMRDVMVCSQNSFLRKWPGKAAIGRDFLFVSRITGNIVWLPKHSPISVGHETYDRERGETYKTVHARKADLRDLSDFLEYIIG
ncbi:hypothetical protein [Acidithiobacillus sp.]|uniref:hypothetical protein n=1 Tax=Acidithiobacillus sp. TaxID=1872118 RepID=UPI00259049B7|nr:hypothetical protein [Acidithiobacillus sp.]MDD5374460.1 hypothetical protein [Acidithiobacillus sp.]